MPRVKRRKKERKPGLESWLKWQCNEFSMFESPVNPWTKEDAKIFYEKNRDEIHQEAKRQGREKNLQDWLDDA